MHGCSQTSEAFAWINFDPFLHRYFIQSDSDTYTYGRVTRFWNARIFYLTCARTANVAE